MDEVYFITGKYLVETSALCVVLSFFLLQDWKQAFRQLKRGLWLILLSVTMQTATHFLFNTYVPAINFTIRYIFWNTLTLCIFWRLFVHKRWWLSTVFITQLVITDHFCQILATHLVYAIDTDVKIYMEFGTFDRVLSTAAIWLLFALVVFLTYRCIRGVPDISFESAAWVLGYGWIFFLVGRVLTHCFLDRYRHPWTSVSVFALFLVLVLLFFGSVMSMLRERKRAEEQARMNQQYALQIQHTDEVTLVYQKLRQLRHEMKNQQLYVEHLLENEEYDALRELFHDAALIQDAGYQAYDCGNGLVNAILWAKMRTAESLAIPLHAEVTLPEAVGVKEHHLCSVLVNLLDNAIEASKTVAEPNIRLYLKMHQNYLFCQVFNRTGADVFQNNPKLHTTKKDPLYHGFGIQSVKMIAEQYHGITKFCMEDGCFVATVMLLCEDIPQGTSD